MFIFLFYFFKLLYTFVLFKNVQFAALVFINKRIINKNPPFCNRAIERFSWIIFHLKSTILPEYSCKTKVLPE